MSRIQANDRNSENSQMLESTNLSFLPASRCYRSLTRVARERKTRLSSAMAAVQLAALSRRAIYAGDLPRILSRTARGPRARRISVLAASSDAGRRLADPRRRSRRVSPERFILADSIPPRRRRLTGVMMLFSCSSNSAPTQKAGGGGRPPRRLRGRAVSRTWLDSLHSPFNPLHRCIPLPLAPCIPAYFAACPLPWLHTWPGRAIREGGREKAELLPLCSLAWRAPDREQRGGHHRPRTPARQSHRVVDTAHLRAPPRRYASA